MLNKGQKVKVRNDLKIGNYYGGIKFTRGMEVYKGAESVIFGTPTVCDYFYYLEDDHDRHEWSEEMFVVLN